MEKVVCALWKDEGKGREAFNADLLTSLPVALREAGASGIRINVRDAEVEPAANLNQCWQTPQQYAVVQYWLPSANALFRADADAALARHCARFAAWLVAESLVIPNRDHPPKPATRTWGWSQASFIAFRPDMSTADALAHWHGVHTKVAIETQSTFEYVQNAIVRPLTESAPAYGAFVEECFPPEAMTDQAVFFDAVGDPARLAANFKAEMDSCAAFIDFARIDIIPTSQFDFA